MDISKAAALSQIYTNHFVRATAIILWSDTQISSRHVMNISGHRNEVKHYNTSYRQVNLSSIRVSCPWRVPRKKLQTHCHRMDRLSGPTQPLQMSVVPAASNLTTQQL